MPAETTTLSIPGDPFELFVALCDPPSLPRWAPDLARAVRRVAGRWLVTTAWGELPLRVVAHRPSLTVDWWLGAGRLAARLLPRRDGAELIVTQVGTRLLSDHALAALSARTRAATPLPSAA